MTNLSSSSLSSVAAVAIATVAATTTAFVVGVGWGRYFDGTTQAEPVPYKSKERQEQQQTQNQYEEDNDKQAEEANNSHYINDVSKRIKQINQQDDKEEHDLKLNIHDEDSKDCVAKTGSVSVADNDNDDDNGNQQQCIYLDYNGTTPIYKEVYESMIPYFTTEFGNPSSAHYYGKKPKQAIDHARKQILRMLHDKSTGTTNCSTVTISHNNNDHYNNIDDNNNNNNNNNNGTNDDDCANLSSIIFTGCGTESDNMAIHLAFQKYYNKVAMSNNKKNKFNQLRHGTNTTPTSVPATGSLSSSTKDVYYDNNPNHETTTKFDDNNNNNTNNNNNNDNDNDNDTTKDNNSNSNNNNNDIVLLPHIVTCTVEHPAIHKFLQVYEQERHCCTVSYVPVQPDGRVNASDMIHTIEEKQQIEKVPIILVTLMLANNEVGSIQPIQEIANYCRRHNILFHVDAAQAVGKISVTLHDLGYPDMITIVGHKIGAPKGIACLYIRPNCLEELQKDTTTTIATTMATTTSTSTTTTMATTTSSDTASTTNKVHGYLLGGGQEYGLRSGTENVPYIVGFGMACELCHTNWYKNKIHMEQMRNLLKDQLEYNLSLLLPQSSPAGSPDDATTANIVKKEHQHLKHLQQQQQQQQHFIRVHGPTDPHHRLPNTLSIGIRGIHSNTLLAKIGNKVAASAGAACHSSSPNGTGRSNGGQKLQVPQSNINSFVQDLNKNDGNLDHDDITGVTSTNTDISPVLRAMKVPTEYARGTIRFSVGPDTTSKEIIQASKIVADAVHEQLHFLGLEKSTVSFR